MKSPEPGRGPRNTAAERMIWVPETRTLERFLCNTLLGVSGLTSEHRYGYIKTPAHDEGGRGSQATANEVHFYDSGDVWRFLEFCLACLRPAMRCFGPANFCDGDVG